MFSKVCSVALVGLEAKLVTVEVDVGAGIPYFDMTGYLSVEVREAKERVKAAIKNSGVEIKPQRIIVNMSPADIRKSGTGFDLPMAVGILIANEVIDDKLLEGTVMVGELSLDGMVKGVKGVLSCVMTAKECGYRRCIVPLENLSEAACVDGIEVYGVECLSQLVDYLDGCGELIKPAGSDGRSKGELIRKQSEKLDYSDVYGQIIAKRATLIAVAGMHNIMYVGAPGSGKTMMSMRIPTIMPDMSEAEMLELTRIYSVAGLIDSQNPKVVKRPFRNPHHSVTQAALLGGGSVPRPGEITLANRGVLFLDELTEYPAQIMESLRQPLEDRRIRINRLSGDYEYPADFMLVAAINPCQCGYYPDRNRCNCSESDIRRYLGKISRPLWDRFDMNVHVEPIDYKSLQAGAEQVKDKIEYTVKEEGNRSFGQQSSVGKTVKTDNVYTSAAMKELVSKARDIQSERFKEMGIMFNSQMNSNLVSKVCKLEKTESELMEKAYEKLGMTARGYHKVLKVARTIADIEGEERILVRHLSEAISYRSYVNG